ncbi:MAG: PIG-L family deacetylase [Chloroflexi bacterium]|nr:PIG-L family deacetylase [Chloroflexota bacterium]
MSTTLRQTMSLPQIEWPSADHIYFAPHPDDVVLSCGGTIHQQRQRGEAVVAVTVFSGSPDPEKPLSPFAQKYHEHWLSVVEDQPTDLVDPMALRRLEDRQSFDALDEGIWVIQLGLLDCIYRTHNETGEHLYLSVDDLFGEVHPADPALRALDDLSVPDHVHLYLPLTIGNHVDHQIVRRAFEGRAELQGRLSFYEDYPYAASSDPTEFVDAAWGAQPVFLNDADLDAKIRAVAQHQSQLSTFWADEHTMAQEIRQFAQQRGGEVFWRRQAD